MTLKDTIIRLFGPSAAVSGDAAEASEAAPEAAPENEADASATATAGTDDAAAEPTAENAG